MYLVWVYSIWGIVGIEFIRRIAFKKSWKIQESKYRVFKNQCPVPKVYVPTYILIKLQRGIVFYLGASVYIAAILAFHYCGAEWADTFVLKSVLSQSGYVLIVMFGLTVGDISKDLKEESKEKHKFLVQLSTILLYIRNEAVTKVVLYEEKAYKSFVKKRIKKIVSHKELVDLFILKFTDKQLVELIGHESEEGIDLLPNRVLKAYTNGTVFREVLEYVFIEEIPSMNVEMIKVLKVFEYCTKKDLKGRDTEKDKRSIQSILDQHAEDKGNVKRIKRVREVDINSIEFEEIELSRLEEND